MHKFILQRIKVKSCSQGVRNCMSGSLCGETSCRGGIRKFKKQDVSKAAVSSCKSSESGTYREEIARLPMISYKNHDWTGLFIPPHGVAVNSSKEVIIIYFCKSLVKLYKDEDKAILTACGEPVLVAVHPTVDDIFVVTKSNHIIKFDEELKAKNVCEGLVGKRNSDVRDASVDHAGNVFIVRIDGLSCVEMYNSDGGVEIMCEHLLRPVSIAARNKSLYVLDSFDCTLKVYNYIGDLQQTMGGKELIPNPFAVRITQDFDIVVGGNVSRKGIEKRQLTIFSAEGTLLGAHEDATEHGPPCYNMAVFCDRNTDKTCAILCNGENLSYYTF